MKINILSDLHIEKGAYTQPFISSDVLVLAGDTCNINRLDLLIPFLEKIPKNQRALMILGNHEYLYSDHNFCEFNLKLILSKFPNITCLENDSIIIDDVKFIGSTLWSDFLAHGEEHYQSSKDFAGKHWTIDKSFTYINNEPVVLDISFSEQKAKKAIRYLEEELSKDFDGKTVVITHFPPSKESTEAAFLDSRNNGFWINKLDFLLDYNPSLWIHGHIHQSKNYIHSSGTHVVCNPRGNLKKVFNPYFDHTFFVEL